MDFQEFAHSTSVKRIVYFAELLEKTGLTMMDIEIIVYLKEYPEKNTFTQVQQWKNYSKSHISTSITHLVEKGYLSKKMSENNKKIHYLIPLDKCNYIVTEYKKCVSIFLKVAFDGVSEKEKEFLLQIFKKVSDNLENSSQKQTQKGE